MGELPPPQSELFYQFCLEKHIPEDHLLRRIDHFLDFTELRQYLQPFYSCTGRPSVDPELMMRMLIIGYCYGIRSERRLCEELRFNLAYRWYCRLGLEGEVPDHSTFSKNRYGRFRDSQLFRMVFESVVERCMGEGVVGGEGFAVDASVIKADAHRARGFADKEGIEWDRAGRKSRAVREYLEALDNDEQVVRAHEATRKAISLTDPVSSWTSAPGGPAFYAYSTNYLIDVDSAIILGVQASSATLSEEAQAARSMIDHTEARFGLKAKHLAADTAYGNAQMPGWLVEEKQITPHIPVFDKSAGKDGQFGRTDFTWEPEADRYVCPDGKVLQRNLRKFKIKRAGITKANTIIYRASRFDCQLCAMKAKCCPKEPSRKIHRSIHEGARDLARASASTEAYAQSRNDRKKVEMLFAHLKRILKLDRLRLRGMTGAQDEFLLAATAQNLRRLVKLTSRSPPPCGVGVPA